MVSMKLNTYSPHINWHCIAKWGIQRRISLWTWSFLKCSTRSDSIMTIYSAVVISVVEESGRCSSKTLQKRSCPYAPLDEVLRYNPRTVQGGFFLFFLFYWLKFQQRTETELHGSMSLQFITQLPSVHTHRHKLTLSYASYWSMLIWLSVRWIKCMSMSNVLQIDIFSFTSCFDIRINIKCSST